MEEKKLNQKMPEPCTLDIPYLGRGSTLVTCSNCGEECCHPSEVVIDHAGNENSQVIVNHKGVHLNPLGAQHVCTRGVVISIKYHCEMCPFVTVHRFNFHKGSTIIHIISIMREVDTIWRD